MGRFKLFKGLSKLVHRKSKPESQSKVDDGAQTLESRPLSPQPADTDLVTTPDAFGNPQSQNHDPTRIAPSTAVPQPPRDLHDLRNETWQKAYDQLRLEQPEVIEAYERLAKEENSINEAAQLSPQVMAEIVSKQQRRMENKQWRYTWFGHQHAVRDTVDTIFGVVQQASGLISLGMTAAPPYVSLPWSMVSVLVPFVVNDVAAVRSAIDGLKSVTNIMARHSHAEREFLIREETRADFQSVIVPLYVSVIEYQAAVALYFAKGTLARLGINLVPEKSWKQALDATNKLSNSCQRPLADFSNRLTQLGFDQIEQSLGQDRRLLQSIEETVMAGRTLRERIQQWLSPVEPMNNHSLVRRQLGKSYFASGKWLLEDPTTYLQWKSSSSDTILLQGIVGSGKSALTSSVVEDLLWGDDGRALFVYCVAFGSDVSGVNTSNTLGILRLLLAQLAIRLDGSVSPTVQAAYKNDHGRDSWNSLSDPSSVVQFMGSILEETPDDQISLIIDGLDECFNYDEVLRHVANLQAVHPHMRLFFSARDGVNITSHFPKARLLPVSINNADDIRTYVETEVSMRYGQVGLTDDQAARLKIALNRLAEGMFRWVQLAMDFYLPPPRPQRRRIAPPDIERRLHELEQSRSTPIERLMNTYEDIWSLALGDEDEQTSREAIRSAIKWVLCSIRPLQLSELLEALSIDSNESFEGTILLERCSNLITKDSAGQVRLAHLSVRQFFEDRLGDEFNPEKQHSQAARCSLLVVIAFRRNTEQYTIPSTKSANAEKDCEEQPSSLALYCRIHWAQHYRLSERNSDFSDLLRTHRHIVNQPFHNLIKWSVKRTTNWPNVTSLSISDFNGQIEPRYLRQGLLERLRNTMKSHRAAVSTAQRGEVTFQWVSASANIKVGHLQLGSNALLYANGALGTLDALQMDNSGELHVRDLDANGNTVLHYAAFFGHSVLLRDFIQRGADIDAVNIRGETPIQIAAAESSASSFLDLLERGASTKGLDIDNIAPTATTVADRLWAKLLVEAHSSSRKQLQHRLNILRLQLKVSQAGRRCKSCDLPQWLDAARQGDSSLFTKGIVQSHDPGHAPECVLCEKVSAQQSVSQGHYALDLPMTVKVVFDSESNGSMGRDVIRFECANLENLDYELYITPHDPDPLTRHAKEILRGQNVSSDIAGTLKSWMEGCSTHPECCAQHPSSHFPSRVIDLQPAIPRLCEGRDAALHTSKYAFLSYSLGRGTNTHEVLTAAKLEEYRRELNMSALPTCWKEVIDIARDIGYRYLWIDALCIIQDNSNDFTRELSAVASYVTNADIVLAMRSTTSYQHLAPQSPPVDVCEPFVASLQHESGSFEIHLRQPLRSALEVMTDEILSRCWQQFEALLPKRLVIFGSEQLYWSCAHGLTSQSDTRMVPAPWTSLPNLHRSRQDRSRLFPAMSLSDDAYRYWYHLVEVNSRGNLTLSSDRFNSFMPLAQQVVKMLDQEKVYAGLLLRNIRHSLLWIHMADTKAGSRKGYDAASYAGPSWSWLSATKAISYGLVPGLQKGSDAKEFPTAHFALEYPAISSVDPVLSAQNLKPGCFIRFSCLALPATDENRTVFKSFPCFFDAEDDVHTVLTDDPHFVIVAPWIFSPSHGSRWVGLIVCRDGKGRYVRTGVFLGPDITDVLDAWERKIFSLY